jgi:hypothetical protein
LEWVKLQPLVENMAGTLADLKAQVEAFLRKYREQVS